MPYGSRRVRDKDRDPREPGRREGREVSRRLGAASTRRPPAPKPRPKLPPEIASRIASDAAFRLLTGDGLHWIDPYTGESVEVSQSVDVTAEQHLLHSQAWRERQPLPLAQLHIIRWRHDLLQLLPRDARWRLFGPDGRGWVNPFTGEWNTSVSKDDNGKVTQRTVAAMAQVLAACPRAQSGALLLDAETLRVSHQAHGGHEVRRDTDPNGMAPVGMTDDLRRAQDLQRHMLADLPKLPGWDFGLHFRPHSSVSGDFYEFIPRPDGSLLIFLGDVSGHGVQAALVVATALKTLRMLARQQSDLIDLLTRFNDEVRGDLLPGQFITIFAARLDPTAGSCQIVLAGHHPPLIANPGDAVLLRQAGRSGMAIGLVGGQLFRTSLKTETVTLEAGQKLLQFTDGIIEAIDGDDLEFGLHRVAGSFLAGSDDPCQTLVDGLAAEVSDWVGNEHDDDVTILAFGRLAVDAGEE